MWRCLLVELFSIGGGHALAGSLRRAAGWFTFSVLCLVLSFWMPVGLWALLVVRLSSVGEAARRGREGPPARGWAWKEALIVVVVSFGFAGAVKAFALESFKIPSSGMSPTLGVGDFFLADKLTLHWKDPERGEIVVYRNGRDVVQRVVAVGGDRVAVRRGHLWLDGKEMPSHKLGGIHLDDRAALAIHESLGGHDYTIAVDPSGHDDLQDYPSEAGGCGIAPRSEGVALTRTPDGAACVVPPGHVFLLGDNRDNSNDSRHQGAFPISAVRARVIGVWLGGVNGRFTNLGHRD